jgi:hypothetical protein
VSRGPSFTTAAPRPARDRPARSATLVGPRERPSQGRPLPRPFRTRTRTSPAAAPSRREDQPKGAPRDSAAPATVGCRWFHRSGSRRRADRGPAAFGRCDRSLTAKRTLSAVRGGRGREPKAPTPPRGEWGRPVAGYAGLSRDADERTRTSTELPPHGPEPAQCTVFASFGVQNLALCEVSQTGWTGWTGRLLPRCCHGSPAAGGRGGAISGARPHHSFESPTRR